MPETIDLTALIEECEAKGEIQLISFATGTIFSAPCILTVVYRGEEFDVNAKPADGYKALYLAVLYKYESRLEYRIYAMVRQIRVDNDALKSFKEFRKEEAERLDL